MYGYIRNFGFGAVYPKIHHGDQANQAALNSLDRGWAQEWQAAGFKVCGWGWVEGTPEREAELAASICKRYGLDGYIANAEAPYEGPANYWKSAAFLDTFRRVAPHAPLGLSYVGEGYPHRDMPLLTWEAAGAAMLPQCYWADASTSIHRSRDAAWRAGQDLSRLCYSLGTSGFAAPYPPERYVMELNGIVNERVGASFNLWLLESTNDNTLRILADVRR